MAELADARDSKSLVRKGVWVQVPLRAPNAEDAISRERQYFVRLTTSAVVKCTNFGERVRGIAVHLRS